MLNQSNAVEAYGGPSQFAFATPVPIRVPRNKSGKHTCHYTIQDALLHPDISFFITLEFEVNHYPNEREFEYELRRDPEIASIEEMHVFGEGITPVHGSQPAAIKAAWRCVREHHGVEELRTACLASIRG